MTCYVAFLKRLQNALNSNINGKCALPVDRIDIKVCFGGEKSKSSNIIVHIRCFLEIKVADM